MRFLGRRRKRARLYFAAGGLLLLLAVPAIWLVRGYALATNVSQPRVSEPEAVAGAWVQALADRDVDGALELLHSDAFLIVMSEGGDISDGTGTESGDGGSSGEIATYEGQQQIREELQRYRADNVRVQIVQPPELVQGTVVWVERRSADSLRQNGITSAYFTGEALVEGGKIRSLIYTPASNESPAIKP